ncbi:MAG: hypothetical protein IT270_20655 [Saprospiraceae bacterium]|nr:hypothetical protein [Saprospiraceae bacterium]
MSIAELKNNLIELAIETDNPRLLKKVITYFKNLREKEDWADNLTDTEKAIIQRSADQIDEKRVVTSDEVQEEAQKILRCS